MNEALRCKILKEDLYRTSTNLRILVTDLSGSRAEDHLKSAIAKLESAWEDLVLAERLIK